MTSHLPFRLLAFACTRCVIPFYIFILLIFASCKNEKEKEIQYYDDGSLKFEINLKDEKREGTGYEYYSDGKLKSKAEWRNGLMEGRAEYYYPSGNLKGVSFWKHGHLKGQSKNFYENGQLKTHMTFINDTLMSGETNIFSEEGILQEKQVYDEYGNLIYLAGYDQKGKKEISSIVPVFNSEKDTIEIEELYKATIEFGYPLKGEVSLALGKIENNSFLSSKKLLPDQANKFIIIHKPETRGVNTIALRFFYETVPEDTLSLDHTTIQHSYYVR